MSLRQGLYECEQVRYVNTSKTTANAVFKIQAFLLTKGKKKSWTENLLDSSFLTFPVMTKQPSWSMMSTSRLEGGWQNFCCKICRMGSIILGVSLSATAMCPKARIVWSGIRWASLLKPNKKTKVIHLTVQQLTRPQSMVHFTYETIHELNLSITKLYYCPYTHISTPNISVKDVHA